MAQTIGMTGFVALFRFTRKGIYLSDFSPEKGSIFKNGGGNSLEP